MVVRQLKSLRTPALEGSYEHRNEPLGLKRGGEFCDWVSDYQLLKMTTYHGAS
jgi:hypothetical protein